MSDRSKLINRLLTEREFRRAYIRAKLDVLIPSQLRALRLRDEKTQSEMAKAADMKQARISAMETPGLVNFNLDTLVRMAAANNSGLMVKFIPFSEMLAWENNYTQDAFDVVRLPNDTRFLDPQKVTIRRRVRRKRSPTRGALFIVRPSQPQVMVGGGGSNKTQMNLQFEVSGTESTQERIATLNALSKPERSLMEESDFFKVAAAGAGRNYAQA